MARELTILTVNSIFCFCVLLHFINKKTQRLTLLDKFSILALVTTVVYFAYQMWLR